MTDESDRRASASPPPVTAQTLMLADRVGGTIPGPSLFVGPDESQVDEKIIRDHGIGRILTCRVLEETTMFPLPRYEHIEYLTLDFGGDREKQSKQLEAALDFLAPSNQFLSSPFDNHSSEAGSWPHALVTCRDGCSLSGLVAVAYLMRRRRIGCDAALALARLSRPGIDPAPKLLYLLRDDLESQVLLPLSPPLKDGEGPLPLLPSNPVVPTDLVESLANDNFTDSESGTEGDSDDEGGGVGGTSNATSSVISEATGSEANEDYEGPCLQGQQGLSMHVFSVEAAGSNLERAQAEPNLEQTGWPREGERDDEEWVEAGTTFDCAAAFDDEIVTHDTPTKGECVGQVSESMVVLTTSKEPWFLEICEDGHGPPEDTLASDQSAGAAAGRVSGKVAADAEWVVVSCKVEDTNQAEENVVSLVDSWQGDTEV